MERGSRVIIIRCTLLALTLWLTAGVVKGESSDDRKVYLPPCVGADCPHRQLQNNNNNNKANADAPHPRSRRQSVVVKGVDKGRGAGSHRVACTQREKRQAACLNGECFALDLGHLRNPFCKCPAKYEGPRCEMLSAYYFLNYYAQIKKGAIIGGVVVGILLIIIAVSVYCSYRKGKRRQKERKHKPEGWGIASPKSETDAMVPDGDSPV